MSRIVLAYKNFAAHKHVSHIGLGVAAINTSKTLARAGESVDVWPIVDANELRQKLNIAKSAGEAPVNCVVVSAPWIQTTSWRSLLGLFPRIKFTMVCHSNVGFLQADSDGIKLFREAMDLEMGVQNFHVAGNSKKFCSWVSATYNRPCQYLPNLYFIDRPNLHRPLYHGGPLRIGAFGATRPLKNFLSAVGAAAYISRQLKADAEIWMSSGRTEGGGDAILRAAREIVAGLPHITLRDAGWSAWPQHRRIVSHMHLLLQPSYTESFNMVTADGIAEGVPSVVSEAIDWAPQHWKAKVDDCLDIARIGRALLSDHHASQEGLEALEAHNQQGITAWKTFLQ